jgi:hypothetical protein
VVLEFDQNFTSIVFWTVGHFHVYVAGFQFVEHLGQALFDGGFAFGAGDPADFVVHLLSQFYKIIPVL